MEGGMELGRKSGKGETQKKGCGWADVAKVHQSFLALTLLLGDLLRTSSSCFYTEQKKKGKRKHRHLELGFTRPLHRSTVGLWILNGQKALTHFSITAALLHGSHSCTLLKRYSRWFSANWSSLSVKEGVCQQLKLFIQVLWRLIDAILRVINTTL